MKIVITMKPEASIEQCNVKADILRADSGVESVEIIPDKKQFDTSLTLIRKGDMQACSNVECQFYNTVLFNNCNKWIVAVAPQCTSYIPGKSLIP